MSIYAIFSGNYDSENIAVWSNLRKEYFIKLLNLKNGIPSVDTSFDKISFKKKLNRYIYDIENINNLIFNVIPYNK